MQCECSSYVPIDRFHLTSRPYWCTEKNPVEIEPFSNVKELFCYSKFA